MTSTPDALIGGEPAELLAELLGQQEGGRRRAMLQLLSMQHGSSSRVDDQQGVSGEVRRRRAARVRHHIAELEAELEELRHRNDRLADALGACRLCWGEHADCDACGGRGRPGWYRPDVAGAKALLGPAIDRLRSNDRRSRTANDHQPATIPIRKATES